MLYDEVKKLLSKSKLPTKFKNDFINRTGMDKQKISNMELETVTALQHGINDATVILIEDNRKIFEEIEDIKIEQFREIKFPFDNFFVELTMQNPEGNSNDHMTIGLHIYPDSVIGLRTEGVYNVFVYTAKNNRLTDIVPLMAILKLNKLPRFYVGCSNKCENIIHPTNFGSLVGNEVCQRAERTADQCSAATFLLYGIKIIIYVVNLINSKPSSMIEVNSIEQKPNRITAHRLHNSKLEKPGKYIYIQVDKPKRKKVRLVREEGRNRKSPVPHTRRGHYRRLNTGKVVWVQMSYIGLKEKEKMNRKIYKVK